MGKNVKSILTETFKAAADLSAKQYYFVKQTAEDTVNVCTALTDVPCGILQNKPDAANKAALVLVIGKSPYVGGASMSVGDLIKTDTSSRGITMTPGTNTTHYTLGQCTEAPTAAGEYGVGIFNFTNLGRGA